MRSNIVSRALIAIILMVLVSSFALETSVPKFSPVGTWEYSVPGVQPGYEKGSMVIDADGKDYKVTMILNEYSKYGRFRIFKIKYHIPHCCRIWNYSPFIISCFNFFPLHYGPNVIRL